MEGLHLSLQTEGRCKYTGGSRVCIGHFDYYGTYMVFTRHFPGEMRYKVISYDDPWPERAQVVVLN